MLRKFTYPSEFKTNLDHRAHSGQIVEVGRILNPGEYGGIDRIERVFEIIATDGWRGEAFESELEPSIP